MLRPDSGEILPSPLTFPSHQHIQQLTPQKAATHLPELHLIVNHSNECWKFVVLLSRRDDLLLYTAPFHTHATENWSSKPMEALS